MQSERISVFLGARFNLRAQLLGQVHELLERLLQLQTLLLVVRVYIFKLVLVYIIHFIFLVYKIRIFKLKFLYNGQQVWALSLVSAH